MRWILPGGAKLGGTYSGRKHKQARKSRVVCRPLDAVIERQAKNEGKEATISESHEELPPAESGCSPPQ